MHEKKQLVGLLEGIVNEVAEKNGLDASEARVFVGVALRANRDAFLNTVVIPRLAVAKNAENATETKENAV